MAEQKKKSVASLVAYYGKHVKKSKTRWYKLLPQSLKDQVNLMRSTYKDLQKMGIRIFEYVMHISDQNIYYMRESWSFYNMKFPDNHPVIIPVIKLDSNETLDLGETTTVNSQHSDISAAQKKNLKKYIKEFNKVNKIVQMKWDGKSSHTVDYKFENIISYN